MGVFRQFCLSCVLIVAIFGLGLSAQAAQKRVQEFVDVDPLVVESSLPNGLVAPSLSIPQSLVDGSKLRVSTVNNMAELKFVMNSDELNLILAGDRKRSKNMIIAVYEEVFDSQGASTEILRASETVRVSRIKGLKNNTKRQRKQIFKIPVPLQRRSSLFKIYLADPQNPEGKAFASYELPEIVSDRFISPRDLNIPDEGIEMPDPNETLSAEEKRLVDAALRAMMQPNFLEIQMTDGKQNPAIVSREHGYSLRIPFNKPGINRKGKKSRAVELPDSTTTIEALASSIVGHGSIADRTILDTGEDLPEKAAFVTIIQQGELVSGDSQLLKFISSGRYDGVGIQGQTTTPSEFTSPLRLVYMSVKQGNGSWENILISGQQGVAGPAGTTAVVTQTVTQQVVNNTPDCGDGNDNDSDGLIDFPNDPGCTSATDNSEFNAVSSPAPPPSAPPSNFSETTTVPNTGAYQASTIDTQDLNGNQARTITITDNVFRNLELVIRLTAAGDFLNYEIFSMGSSGGIIPLANNGSAATPQQIYLMELELYLDPTNNNVLTWRSFDRGAGRRAHRLDIFYSTTP